MIHIIEWWSLKAFLFAAIYPIFLWVVSEPFVKMDWHPAAVPSDKPSRESSGCQDVKSASLILSREFFRSQMVIPNCVGGAVLILIWFLDVSFDIKVVVTVWKIFLFSISRYSWRKTVFNPVLFTGPVILGAGIGICWQGLGAMSSGLSKIATATALGMVFFATNLGRKIHLSGMAQLYLARINLMILSIFFIHILLELFSGTLVGLTSGKVYGGLLMNILIGLRYIYPVFGVLCVYKAVTRQKGKIAIGIWGSVFVSLLLGEILYCLVIFG